MTAYIDPANPHRIYKVSEPAADAPPKLKKKPIGCTTSIAYRQRLQLTFFPLSFIEPEDLNRFTAVVWAFMDNRGPVELEALTQWAESEIPKAIAERAHHTKITYDLFKSIFTQWETSETKRLWDKQNKTLTPPSWLGQVNDLPGF